jgi:prophage DNA circulation protein
MGVFEQLQEANIGGLSVLTRTETKEGGKKTVTHEYIGSDKRYTEGFGKLPPKFVLEVIVTDLYGADALIRRQILEHILEEPGLIELVHPVYGSVQVKSTTYTVSSNQTEIGEFRFSINFETSESTPIVSPVQTTSPAASNLAIRSRRTINIVLGDEYPSPAKPSILEKIAKKATSIYDTVYSSISSATNTIQSKVSEFTSIINNGKSKINSIVQQGTTMKQSLEDLYSSMLVIVNTPADLKDSWESLLDFGFVDDLSSIFGTGVDTTSTESSAAVDTSLRIGENKNKELLNEHTRLNALINLYEAAAYKEYDTDTDIDAMRKILNDSFKNQIVLKIIDSSGNTLSAAQLAEMSPIAADLEVRKNIQELRTTVNKILDQKEQNVWKVQSISPGVSSMLLTTYKYYGNIDNLSLLTGLNPDVNSANFDQDIQAVSE